MTPSRTRLIASAILGVGLAAAAIFTTQFPAVEGLGTKVRLPVFHGALTWVNLVGFVTLGVVAVAYLVTRRTGVYRWLESLRWTLVSIWLIGSGLGLMAAFNTWDFTGSTASPLSVAMADPRMIAQFWIVVLALGVLAMGLIVDERHWLAATDAGFVVVAWTILLRAVLGPGRALHPDSPVMNSDEIFIKLMFIGIFASLLVATAGGVMLVRAARQSKYSENHAGGTSPEVAAEAV